MIPHVKRLLFFLTFVSVLLVGMHFAFAESKWAGVDESIVEKIAEENGRKAWTPFINTDQGDLLLFVFLIAGTAGGFMLGFYWRKLFCETNSISPRHDR